MDWRIKFAAVGAVILVAAIVATIWGPRHVLTLVRAEGTRFHSFDTNSIPHGFCGPITTTKWIHEKWSWELPDKIIASNSGRLRVQVEVTEESSTIAGPVDGRCPNRKETRKPSHIREPMTVSVAGPFKWGGEQKQTTPADHSNPLEWSWVFSSEEPGDKIILLELPARKGGLSIETTRVFEVRDSSNNVSSRFVQIPIKVLPSGLISPQVQSILVALGWLVGPAFSAPWLVWLWRRVLSRKDEYDTA